MTRAFIRQDNQWYYILTFLFFILFCNSYTLLRFYYEGNLYADFNGYVPINDNNVILLYLSIVILYIAFVLIYKLSTKIGTNYKAIPLDSTNIGTFILLYQITFFVFNLVEGVNQAGVRGESSNPISYIFILLRPDILFLLYFSSYSKSKLLYINVIFYLISMLSRGWLGVISDIIIIAIIRRDFPIRKIILSKWVLLCIFMIFLLPILVQIRSIYRLEGLAGFDSHSISFQDLNILYGFDILFSRYQQLFSLIYFSDNLKSFQDLYEMGRVQPLYTQGLIPNYIYQNFFNSGNFDSLGFLLADTSRNLVYGRITAFTTGLLPYFMISIDWPISLFYIVFCIVLCGFFTRLLGSRSPLLFVTFFYLSKYLMAGWFNILFSFLITLVFFTLIHIIRLRRV